MGIQVQPGWEKSKRTSLEGDFPEFRYVHVASGFQVVSDKRGVRMLGTSYFFTKPEDYDNFAWVLGDAGRENIRFKRNTLSVVGDNELKEITKKL